MRINKFGQVTNKSSDLLLTPQQEEFMKSLLDNGKATSLSLRYGRAVANKVIIPSTIHDMTFDSMEEAFKCMDSLEYAAEHTNDFDSQDANLMQALQYYFGKSHKMVTKEINDLMSLIADTAFRIGIIIDKAEYHLDQDKDIREHSKNVINSLLSAKGL